MHGGCDQWAGEEEIAVRTSEWSCPTHKPQPNPQPQQIQLQTTIPVIFGVLTCLNEGQAKARSTGENNHGISWGKTAVEMALMRTAALSKAPERVRACVACRLSLGLMIRGAGGRGLSVGMALCSLICLLILCTYTQHNVQATLPLTEGREETPADKKQERKFGF